jgi:hypothetical protein
MLLSSLSSHLRMKILLYHTNIQNLKKKSALYKKIRLLIDYFKLGNHINSYKKVGNTINSKEVSHRYI